MVQKRYKTNPFWRRFLIKFLASRGRAKNVQRVNVSEASTQRGYSEKIFRQATQEEDEEKDEEAGRARTCETTKTCNISNPLWREQHFCERLQLHWKRLSVQTEAHVIRKRCFSVGTNRFYAK